MSVINQMLRDLEQRKIKETASAHYIDEVNIVAKKTISPWWIILPFIIIIVIAINLYLHSLNKNKRQLLSTEQSVAASQNMQKEVTPKLEPIVPQVQQQKSDPSIEPQKAFNKATIDKQTPVRDKSPKQKANFETVEKSVNSDTVGALSITTNKLENPPVVAKKTSIKSADNNSASTAQSIKKTINKKSTADNTAAYVKVKLPVKTQARSVNKQITVSAEQLVYQARLLMNDNQPGAAHLLEKNLSQITPDADYYALLANLNQRRQNYDNAINYYQKALEIAPHKGEIWIGIALAYQATGEEKNAMTAFKQALATQNLSAELRNYARQQVRQ